MAAEAVLGATIQVVLQNVLSAIQEIIIKPEIKLVRDYEQDLTQLRSSLETIQAYLYDAEAKRVGIKAVQLWLNRLEDVAFEADAVLGEVTYELLRRQVKKQNRESNKVHGLLPSAINKLEEKMEKWPRKLIFKRKMASKKIKHVNAKLENINKEATAYGLQTQMAFAVAGKTNTSTPPERETDSDSVETYIVGRENEVSEIVENLIKAPPQQTISVIPIVGMGGVGKTTLARKVFNDEKIKHHFDEKMWVYVPKDFDTVSLFKKILETLTEKDEGDISKQVVLQKIKKRLEEKRYLLVLDDVWNEKYVSRDEFMTPLSRISDVKGNCIVVTTRNENIALHVGTLLTHQLLVLSESQCWSIIKAQTFIGMDIPGEFERIGKCIAERCRGVPLAAKVVGGLLRDKKSEEDWRRILREKLSDLSRNNADADGEIKTILKLSYDNLPLLSHKKCFAYCSVFPQGFKMGRQQLIELWMAEGFLQADNKGKDMETVGSEIFNHLLQYSLFQDAERDAFGDIVHCKMHDLFHEVACSITKEMHRDRYLAIKSTTNEPPVISPEQTEQTMYLRTLFFNGKIANNVFPNFKCLHVLKLTCWEIKELPPVIEKLIHLRSLDISATMIECLPDSIGKLYHLQTLHGAHYLKKIPNTIINLVSLRHLYISDSIKLCELPPGIGKLTSLRTLPYYNVRDEKGCRIGELGNLKNLKGVLEIVNLQRVKDKEEAKIADLYRKPGIVKLVLKWNESRDGERKDENVLDGLQPHPRLKSLEIIGYEGRNFPLRMAAHNEEPFNNLIEIKLTKCTRCEELPMLGRLPHLRFLELNNLRNVRSISPSFYGCVSSAFPALEVLKLWEMPELTELVDMEGAVTVFPSLEELTIYGCAGLKSIIPYDARGGQSQKGLTSLRQLSIWNCQGLTDLSIELLGSCTSSLEELTIKGCPGLKSIPYDARGGQGLTSLRILCIVDCQGIAHLPIELLESCASSLKKLEVVGCPGLKSIPYNARGGQSQQGLTSLRILRIVDCQGITDLPIELLESCSLETLSFDGSENLENLDTLIPCVWRMPRLQRLSIIGGLSESINLDKLNRLFRECRSLEILRLSGKEDWDSLPNQIQHLTVLQELTLHGFGIESLPEWIGNLSSLETLQISNCKRLRHLPSKEAMQRRSKLSQLRIDGSPLLKVERCSPSPSQQQTTPGGADDDSEWPKISHIQDVTIDGRQLLTRNCEYFLIF